MTKRLMRRVVPEQLRDAYAHLRTPQWVHANRLDDALMRSIVRASVDPMRGMIDVGANRGSILRAAVEAAPTAHHIAFEPNHMVACELRRLAPSVEVHEYCVGAVSGQVDFFNYDRHTRSSKSFLADEPLASRTTVEQVSLDDFISSNIRYSIVKVDVEGHELGVLKGGEQLLSRMRPILLFEHGSPDGGSFPDTQEIFEFLDLLDYRCFALRGDAVSTYAEFAAAVDSGSYWNFVAIPRTQ